MTRLIIVRHGYSVTNADKRYTGQMDVALTEIGHAQARCVADYLTVHEKIDAIYASDLQRALDTARPTAERLGLTVTAMPALRELGMGIWEGMSFDDVRQGYAELLALRAKDPTVPCPEGESFLDLFTRVTGAIREILQANEGRTVMVVTHGGAVRCIDCMANGGTYRDASGYRNIDNAAMSIYCFENNTFTREAHGMTAHLANSVTALAELQ